MLKTTEVEIKKEHNVLLVNKITDFKKSGRKTKDPKDKKPQKGSKYVVGPPKVPKVKPGVTCFYCKGMVTGYATAPSTLKTRRPTRFLPKIKVYVIYMQLISILQVPKVSCGYLIPVLLLTYVTLRRVCRVSDA
jgi:hypothetical protein